MNSSNLYDCKLQYGATSLLVIFFIYISQQSKRKIFLQEISKREWEFIGKNILPMSIITVKYNKKSEQITLDKINDKAKKQLHISKNQEFQQFTRNTIIVDNNDNFYDVEICSKSGFFTNFSKSQSVKINTQQQETLEQKLLQTLKKEIKQPQQFKGNLIDFFQKKYQKAQTQINNEKADKSLTSSQNIPKQSKFYGLLKKDNQTFQISFSTYTLQNQKSTFCCLLFGEAQEQLHENKLSHQQNTRTIQEKMFFESCLYIGDKLQNIVENISNQEAIKANIFQSYNRMYNFKDYFQILKNRFKMRLESSVISSISQQSVNEIQQYNNDNLQSVKNHSFEQNKNEEIPFEFHQQQQNNQYLKVQFEEMCKYSSIQENSVANQEFQSLKKQQLDNITENEQEQKLKVSYNIIGNIGPFYNLYAKYFAGQACEFHFYIFKNAEIVKGKDLNKQQIFQNSLYQKHLSISNLEYFHLNNMEDLKNQINKSSSNSLNDIKINEESYQQGNALAKLEFQFMKFNSFLDKESFSIQSSVNQYTIQFLKSMYKSIISPKNHQYQFKTKFMKQSKKTDDLSPEKKIDITNL
ncbi:hypothetical protein ABPG72_022138 [Tetrahymena utriculariae]